MNICVFNLGCKVNQYESDVLIQELISVGHNAFSNLAPADLYIINSCAVTGEAERKSRQAVQRCMRLNPDARIIMGGCASQNAPGSFAKKNIVYVTGAGNKLDILKHINDIGGQAVNAEKEESADINTGKILEISGRTRAYVKIQDGCDSFCSYCLIPHLRGRSRSRNEEEILKEIQVLSGKTKEIVLTGINLMAYGSDNGTTLMGLIRKLKDLEIRLRLGSFYAEGLDEEMLDALFSIKHFCPHFHLSLQSGDNGILQKMNRRYTAEIYLEKIGLIRKYDANAAVTTDIIVGFPTETEAQFKNTLDFTDAAKFSDIHVFPYSARNGTPAAKLPQINGEVINERKNIMLDRKAKLHSAYLNANIGVVQNVLFEHTENGISGGYSERYIKVYAVAGEETAKVMPKKIYRDGLKGDIIYD